MSMLEQELRNALAADPQRVMIIVGAGVTLGALHGTPHAAQASWGGLIRDGLAYAVELRALDRDDAKRLEGLLQSNRPGLWISAAQQLTEALGGPTGGDFKAWLRRSVGAFAPAVRDRSVLDVLADLEQRGATIATVNYDSLLEQATGLRAVTWRQASEVDRVLKDAHGILHLHGHWEDSESIVLGTSSYDDVVRNDHARAALTSMRMLKTLVFVGHGAGLRDPNWGSFLDWTAKVFPTSEYRHYRIARQNELDELSTPALQAQRISLVGYPGGYENLGPFLRSLVPPQPVASGAVAMPASGAVAVPAEPAVEHVLLLVNIGENDHRFVSPQDVLSHGGVPKTATVLETPRRVLDLKVAGPREWRSIAKDLDALIDRAEAAARDAKGPVCFVIAGAAPLPVFAYLGHHSKRLVGTVLFLNRSDLASGWDRIGPLGGPGDFPPSLRTMFTLEDPKHFRDEQGKVALFVACSTLYKCLPEALAPVTSAEGQPLSCIYRVTSSADPKADRAGALGEGDLRGLMDLVSKALAAAQETCPKSTDLVLAYGGPTWAAFWLGRVLNAKVSGNIEFPNFVTGTGYVRALASQMWRQRWVAGQPHILILAAEPDNEARTRAGAQLTAIKQAIDEARQALDHVHDMASTKVGRLLGLLDREQPDILHIYAHGGEDGSLGFEDDRGDIKRVPAERFLDVLRATTVRPSLTVVCACHSIALAPGLLEFSDCVVNVKGLLPYRHATLFIEAFYAALARGRTVQAAFDQGKAHAGVVLDSARQPFELLSREGVEPSQMFFWAPARSPKP